MSFRKHDMAEVYRITPISRVSDQQIWERLVTPLVKALLGPLDFANATCGPRDTGAGVIDEDRLFNINDHRLHNGQSGAARFPIWHSCYPTANGGYFIVRRDGIKFEVFCSFPVVDRATRKKKQVLVYKLAMRDRRYDGTRECDDCAIEHFSYADPKLNGNFMGNGKSVELYLFTYWPDAFLDGRFGDPELALFCANPFMFRDRVLLARQLLDRAMKTEFAPGQYACPVLDATPIVPIMQDLARELGYDFVEVACSHYHIARWMQVLGHEFSDAGQAERFAALRAGIERIKASGMNLTRSQESWVAVAQFLPPDLIPDGLYLNGLLWEQTNDDAGNVWTYLPLHDKALDLLPASVYRGRFAQK